MNKCFVVVKETKRTNRMGIEPSQGEEGSRIKAETREVNTSLACGLSPPPLRTGICHRSVP
jgi:hypothetical protein